jgi:hypothetical protein
MADNVGYTPGAGATVAADDIGGVLHQRVKIGIGDDGTAVDVSSSNPMPVSVDTTTPLNVKIADVSTTTPIPVTAANSLPVTISETDPLTLRVENVRNLMNVVLQLLDSPRGYEKSVQRQRGTVVVESGTVTTVTTVANLQSIDSIQGRIGQLGQNLSAWSECVR